MDFVVAKHLKWEACWAEDLLHGMWVPCDGVEMDVKQRTLWGSMSAFVGFLNVVLTREQLPLMFKHWLNLFVGQG